jgi:hypothetical protein
MSHRWSPKTSDHWPDGTNPLWAIMSTDTYWFAFVELFFYLCYHFQLRSIEKLEAPTDEELPVTCLSTFMTVLKEGIQDRLINGQARTWKIATFLNPRWGWWAIAKFQLLSCVPFWALSAFLGKSLYTVWWINDSVWWIHGNIYILY